MSQHDYNLTDQSRTSFRADLNSALGAIVSLNSGPTEPAVRYAGMFWVDTASGTLKMRDTGNVAWITVLTLETGLTSSFPAGTRMAFNQTAAPTGWTKDVTINDSIMRIVSGTVGAGGSVAFSTAAYTPTISIGTLAVAGHVLTVAEMPSHTHSLGGVLGLGNAGVQASGTPLYQYLNSTGATGGDGAHTHGLNGVPTSSAITLNLKYNDFIICSKN